LALTISKVIDLIAGIVSTTERLALAVSAHDKEAVQSSVTELWRGVEGLDVGRHPGLASASLSAEATSAAWLIKASATEVQRESAEAAPDWDSVGAAFSFMETGVQVLSEAVRQGGPSSVEDL
jgi:hypothetical protein